MIDELRKCFSYDPDTGVVTPLVGRGRGSWHPQGYLTFCFRGNSIMAHRIAWALTYGYWPRELDHINRDKGDNRLSNLREVTSQQNRWNSNTRRGVSGYKGVTRNRLSKTSPWRAAIRMNGKYIQIGTFKTAKAAAEARNKALEKYQGEYAFKDAAE